MGHSDCVCGHVRLSSVSVVDPIFSGLHYSGDQHSLGQRALWPTGCTGYAWLPAWRMPSNCIQLRQLTSLCANITVTRVLLQSEWCAAPPTVPYDQTQCLWCPCLPAGAPWCGAHACEAPQQRLAYCQLKQHCNCATKQHCITPTIFVISTWLACSM